MNSLARGGGRSAQYDFLDVLKHHVRTKRILEEGMSWIQHNWDQNLHASRKQLLDNVIRGIFGCVESQARYFSYLILKCDGGVVLWTSFSMFVRDPNE